MSFAERSRSHRVDEAMVATCSWSQGETVVGAEKGRLFGGGSISDGPYRMPVGGWWGLWWRRGYKHQFLMKPGVDYCRVK